MSPGRLVDLAQVRAARARLDAVVREHPECQGPKGPQNVRGWEAALEEDERKTMSSEPTIQCAFRLPASLVERLDAHAVHMSEKNPGVTFTRADAVRLLLTSALGPAPGPNAPRRRR